VSEVDDVDESDEVAEAEVRTEARPRRLAATIAQAVVTIFYPVLIWIGLRYYEPRQVAFVALGVLALRFAIARPDRAREAVRMLWLPALAIGTIIGAVVVWNDPLGLLLMPVAISAGFLATFLTSLRRPPPMVERFARIQVGTLSDAEVAYCRTVTKVWCGFFVLNGAIAGGLAFTRHIEAWATYTGLVSYVLMGLLFAGEYVVRWVRFRRVVGGFAEPLLARFFPPREP